jgi:hypothetical protein
MHSLILLLERFIAIFARTDLLSITISNRTIRVKLLPERESARASRVPVAVYGLSSEGYQIASKLAAKGFEVSVIDENMGTGMVLRPEVAADYPELRLMIADEPLLEIRPSKECIAGSKVIFFTPKLRRGEEDLNAEVRSRLAEISKFLNPNSLIVFCLPVGIGGTKDMIDRAEHSSGLSHGKDFLFSYSPLDAGKPTVFGCDRELGEHLGVIEAAGFAMEIFTLHKAELVHAQRTISRYSNLGSTFEVAKRLTQNGFESPREYRQIYADDLSSSLYDLKLLAESLDTGDPLLILASGSLKSIESYSRFLVERTRELVRTKELKASRLKILLFTDADSLEMRGERLTLARAISEKLRDFFSDIDYLNMMKEGFTPPIGLEKTNLLIFLSGSGEQKLTQLYDEQITMTKSHIIRANLPVEFVRKE